MGKELTPVNLVHTIESYGEIRSSQRVLSFPKAFGSNTLFEADVDLKTVADILGHASMIMAGDLYADVLERIKRKTSNKLAPLIPV